MKRVVSPRLRTAGVSVVATLCMTLLGTMSAIGESPYRKAVPLTRADSEVDYSPLTPVRWLGCRGRTEFSVGTSI